MNGAFETKLASQIYSSFAQFFLFLYRRRIILLFFGGDTVGQGDWGVVPRHGGAVG